MNENSNVKSLMTHDLSCHLARHGIKAMVAVLGFAVLIGGPVYAAEPTGRIIPTSTELAPRMEFSPGQSHLIRMPAGVNLKRVKVEDDKIVQVEVTSPREIVLHAKNIGSTSLMIWDKSGQVTIMDIGVIGSTVAMDATALQGKLKQMLPDEKGIFVGTAGRTLVLSGTATDAVKVDKAMTLAEAYAGKDNKVINMMQVGAPQQVMLEVKMAEISKNLLDQLGVNFKAGRVNGGVAYDILSGFRLQVQASWCSATAELLSPSMLTKPTQCLRYWLSRILLQSAVRKAAFWRGVNSISRFHKAVPIMRLPWKKRISAWA